MLVRLKYATKQPLSPVEWTGVQGGVEISGRMRAQAHLQTSPSGVASSEVGWWAYGFCISSPYCCVRLLAVVHVVLHITFFFMFRIA